MDRNEAIEHLKVVLKTCDVQDEEAVKMAIEALSCSEIPNNSDTISRQQALDALEWKWAGKAAIDAIKKLPPAQPERKDAIEKAVAVEAISDELMSRFDISATYAYEVAEAAVNRIEVMAKKMYRGEDG